MISQAKNSIQTLVAQPAGRGWMHQHPGATSVWIWGLFIVKDWTVMLFMYKFLCMDSDITIRFLCIMYHYSRRIWWFYLLGAYKKTAKNRRWCVWCLENWLRFTVHGFTMFYHRIIQVSPQIFPWSKWSNPLYIWVQTWGMGPLVWLRLWKLVV